MGGVARAFRVLTSTNITHAHMYSGTHARTQQHMHMHMHHCRSAISCACVNGQQLINEYNFNTKYLIIRPSENRSRLWKHKVKLISINFLAEVRVVHIGSFSNHYKNVIMTSMASKITSLTVVYSFTVYSDADQRKHHSSALLAFVRVKFTGTREFPAQRACYAENVSIWWRHHGKRDMI